MKIIQAVIIGVSLGLGTVAAALAESGPAGDAPHRRTGGKTANRSEVAANNSAPNLQGGFFRRF